MGLLLPLNSAVVMRSLFALAHRSVVLFWRARKFRTCSIAPKISAQKIIWPSTSNQTFKEIFSIHEIKVCEEIVITKRFISENENCSDAVTFKSAVETGAESVHDLQLQAIIRVAVWPDNVWYPAVASLGKDVMFLNWIDLEKERWIHQWRSKHH